MLDDVIRLVIFLLSGDYKLGESLYLLQKAATLGCQTWFNEKMLLWRELDVRFIELWPDTAL